MKRITFRLPHALGLSFLIVAAVSFLSPSASFAAESGKAKVVNVDYVIALMDAGIDQKEIIHRIEARNLTFRIESGDVDRLREAGAGKNLIEVVVGEQAEPETVAPQGDQGSATSEWGRPNRMGGTGSGSPQGDESYAPPASGDEGDNNNGEGIEESPYYGGGYGGGYGGYGSYPDYGDYWPGYYGFVYTYGYPYYYYYPYYSAYYYPYRYHYYGGYSYPRHYFRGAPRGGGWVSSGPRGGGMHSAPRMGGHSSPRGSGGGHSAPRGSHH